MRKVWPIIVVVVLVGVAGFLIWPKSQVKPVATTTIKKIDLSTQPQWVQQLKVTAVKGRSGNGLDNVTIQASGMSAGMVQSLTYVIQYDTTNKGTQGALSSEPVVVAGAVEFKKTIDLGTCSTKSCVRHDGVTAVGVELDFTTTSGDQPIWTGTLPL